MNKTSIRDLTRTQQKYLKELRTRAGSYLYFRRGLLSGMDRWFIHFPSDFATGERKVGASTAEAIRPHLTQASVHIEGTARSLPADLEVEGPKVAVWVGHPLTIDRLQELLKRKVDAMVKRDADLREAGVHLRRQTHEAQELAARAGVELEMIPHGVTADARAWVSVPVEGLLALARKAAGLALAVLVVSLSVAGCGSSSRPGGPATAPGVEVRFGVGIVASHRAVLAGDVAAVVSAWEGDFGVELAPLLVEVTLDLAPCQSSTANGCAFLADRRVLVYAQDRLWQLYHELCHAGLELPDHSDPRWAAWDLRGAEVIRGQ